MKITSKFLRDRFGFSRQQLYYWRKVGIISPSLRTSEKRGHFRYDFQDLKILKTINYLRDSGISTYRIRKCFFCLRRYFPEMGNPFSGKPILVFGRKIIFINEGRCYDAISGQLYLIDFKKMRKWSSEVISFEKAMPPDDVDIILWVKACN